MDDKCLIIRPPLPIIPALANYSIPSNHPTYEPGTGGLTQIISSKLARSTFSNNDIRSLLNRIVKDEFPSSVPSIMKVTPIPSILTYSIIALCLCLILSLTFCIISCVNYRKKPSQPRHKPRQSTTMYVCIGLLTLVYLLGIGDMIYVAVRVNKSTSSIDDTIEGINQEIYPKKVSEHLLYINKQLRQLDQYLSQPNSVLINASQSILVTSFNDILKEKYFLQDLLRTVNEADRHFTQLAKLVHDDPTISPGDRILFTNIEGNHRQMIEHLETPLKQLCYYDNQNDTNIDMELLNALGSVHQELGKIINMVDQDILQSITPWQNHMLLSKDLEEDIRRYFKIGGTIAFAFIFGLAGIPLIFFLWIGIYRLCCARRNRNRKSKSEEVPMEVIRPSNSHRRQDQSKKALPPTSRPTTGGPSGVCVCLMRLAFVLMFIMLLIMVLLTGVFYSVDLSVQGTCRMAHDDQTFLTSLILNEITGKDNSSRDNVMINTTILNMIEDCRSQVHFSRKFLASYWSNVDNGITGMMEMLNELIYNDFITSIAAVDLVSNIDQLELFANQTDKPAISAKVDEFSGDLTQIDTVLMKINNTNASLPSNLVEKTVKQFRTYLTDVLKSTVDGCPLPLATLYHADTLTCHNLASSFDGLWLSLFIFLMLVTFGLCIFGLCIYKRLN